jgi:uncharacterized protein YndB with AHSA1/START domain
MSCVYDAPGRLVEGHTAPEPQEYWQGPNGHTLLSWEVDFGDGGGSRLRVRSPEGRGYSVEGVRLEIVEPERIVFTGTLEAGGERLTEMPGTVTFRRIEGHKDDD